MKKLKILARGGMKRILITILIVMGIFLVRHGRFHNEQNVLIKAADNRMYKMKRQRKSNK